MPKIIFLFLILIFSSCFYGVNERTSGITDLNYSCKQTDWDKMKIDHSVESSLDSTFIRKINHFKTKPFESELFYFKEKPQEIIAISSDHYQIRYVYNPKLSNKILDGFSEKLNNKEVDRISNRIHAMLEKYGCSEND